MKRVSIVLLFAVLMAIISVGLSSCGRKGNDDVVLEFEIAADGGSYRVKGSNISDEQLYYWGWDDVDVIVPALYNGLPVTEIADSAFYNAGALRSIQLPETINVIGDAAFMRCVKLEKIRIPEGVTVFDSNLFHSCESLVSVSVPSSIEHISPDAFIGCSSLEEINVSEDNEHYKTIDGNLYSFDGKQLLQYCAGKTDAEFQVPDGIEEIVSVAFGGNKSLESVMLPASIKKINFKAFSGCENFKGVIIDEENPYFVSIDGNVYTRDGAVLIRYYYSEEGAFTVPDHVTKIAEYAFFDCAKLEEVIIPEGVTRIDRGAFLSTGLREIEIPESIVYIGAAAFSHCFDLKKVIFVNTEDWTVVGEDNPRAIPSDKLEDRKTAAKYLCTLYGGAPWERQESFEEDSETGEMVDD